jgi:predicted nucleic acid-binding protein
MKDARTFVDTNILVYGHDLSAGQKYEKAARILLDLWETGLGILSTQVLQEFLVTVTTRIPRPLDLDQAEKVINDLLLWNVVVNDSRAILSAIDLQRRYRYTFWDSLILQAAVAGGAGVLLSEDLQGGQVIDSLKIVNPFE